MSLTTPIGESNSTPPTIRPRSRTTRSPAIRREQPQGIYVAGTDALISGNTVSQSIYLGIWVSGGARATISGNQLSGNGTGIRAGFDGALADRIVVSGNTIHGGSIGIDAGANVNFTGDVLVTQNEVYGLSFGLSVGAGCRDAVQPGARQHDRDLVDQQRADRRQPRLAQQRRSAS